MTTSGHKTIFTVFTAAYNRAHTLPLLFNSLMNQELKDFEWIVVDDGSTDNTAELVSEFHSQANFRLIFLTQPHRGKMRAHNTALKHSAGDLFLNVDSDDYLFPHTLSQLKDTWLSLPKHSNPSFAGISALSVDPDGKTIGSKLGPPALDSSYDELVHSNYNKKRGDCLELWQTSILKLFPYPEIEGELFVPDTLIFHRMSRFYLVRFINKPLQIVAYQKDGISNNSIYYRSKSPQGMKLYYQEMINNLPNGKVKVRCRINLFRYIFHHNKTTFPSPFARQTPDNYFPLKLFGWLLYLRDMMLIKLHSGESSF